MKKQFEQIKGFVKEYQGEIIIGGAILTGVAIAAIVHKNVPKGMDIVIDEKKIKFKDVFLYQLTGQDENWMVITSDLNSKGNPTNIQEIARQIANGEYREG